LGLRSRLFSIALKESDWAAAARYLEKSLDLKPNQPQVLQRLAQVYLKTRQYDAAVRLYEQVAKTDPTAGLPFTEIGRIYVNQGRYAAAIDILQRHPLIKTGDADLYFTLGEAYEKLGQYRQAQNYFRKCFIINSDLTGVAARLGRMLRLNGDIDGAIAHLEGYLGTKDSDVDAHLELGTLYQIRKKYGPAYDHFNRVTVLDPQNPEPWNKIGNLKLETGNKKDAWFAFSKSLDIDPNQPAIRNKLKGW
jgi:tetratricopeptide (TPR) repeat protein